MNYDEKEERIQEIYAAFKSIRNPNSSQLAEFTKHFFELFSDDIYAFPIRFYSLDDDEAGDFYLYAFEHLRDGRKLSQYEGKSRFTTWFFSVLRNLTIDFLRTRRNKLQFASSIRLDASGALVDVMSQIADQPARELPEEELLTGFQEEVSALKIEQRLLLKLAYLHYFDLMPDELEYLAVKTGQTPEAVFAEIIQLKETARQKANEVREIEDRLTANFQSIMVLESRIEAFFKDNPEFDREADKWDENYMGKGLPIPILESIHALVKKKKKQAGLLLQQKRSLASIRLPYKDISRLLGVSQSILSVQLARILERLSQALHERKKMS